MGELLRRLRFNFLERSGRIRVPTLLRNANTFIMIPNLKKHEQIMEDSKVPTPPASSQKQKKSKMPHEIDCLGRGCASLEATNHGC
jgi:hypothetical protein